MMWYKVFDFLRRYQEFIAFAILSIMISIANFNSLWGNTPKEHPVAYFFEFVLFIFGLLVLSIEKPAR